ncbi:MAG: dTDP-4-dehydrorhamnose reductase [Bacteroidales bacterium]|jgi:dTDP-4-dehydrorhamnose reductase|nr:dTDP-4-dehydrorhamnose reductase [Bacteroidales bacterium]MED9961747.1 dTDP-4-dehydrorhamnose reductase [Bacteroidales bacterium]MEE0266514.1 dTDP-4-dehydrorhamnose reductase [Bacteroidales bacterium]MEE1221638.1 dTDP-4-dehydrorhamnose reductase [Bacteroidales bacterium]MEE1323835.1 dTDP-4-dehydrorhamnose reductase [Bacteroidales bacterium]
MKNVLVTGAEGQLGSSLKKIAGNFPQYNFIYTDKDNLDICNEQELKAFFENNSIYCVLHFAAYTAVDKAEDEESLAEKINSEASLNIAKICAKHKARLVYISTDYVFEGKDCKPHSPQESTNPLSVYGKTKLKGEENCLKNNPLTFVIRTSWLYSEFKSNFVKTMINLSQTKEELNVIYDQIGSPTYARDLAEFSIRAIEHINTNRILHFSNQGVCSWYDFARKAIELWGEKQIRINPILTSQYHTKATRPKFSVFDKSESEKLLDIKIPHWEESLKECIKELKAQIK